MTYDFRPRERAGASEAHTSRQRLFARVPDRYKAMTIQMAGSTLKADPAGATLRPDTDLVCSYTLQSGAALPIAKI